MDNKIKHFIAITFGFSWFIWLPGVLAGLEVFESPVPDKVLLLVGALSPFLATFYLERKNKRELKNIISRSFNPRIGIKWLLICILLPILSLGISHMMFSLFDNNLSESGMLTKPLMAIPLFIVMFLFGGGLNEEIGWRNYVLEYYLKKYNALKASVILSFFWILWHLPLFFMDSTNQALLPYWLFVLTVIPLTIQITWIYNNTGGSIFAVALFHSMGNLSLEIFRVMPTTKSPSILGFIFLGVVYLLISIILVIMFGYKTLSKQS